MKEKSEWKNFVGNVSDLYNSLLADYEQQYSDFSDQKKKSKLAKHNLIDLFFNGYEYNDYFDKEPKVVKEELDNLSSQEGEEEKYYSVPSTPMSNGDKEGKGLKILTPDKLLTRLLIPLAQIKAGNNSKKLKTKSDKKCIFCISIIKSSKIFIKT